ncbi:MAG: reverse transcriptase domain-containing protein [Tepidisphaeraceae bacterium]|jgi:hypothetical protein
MYDNFLVYDTDLAPLLRGQDPALFHVGDHRRLIRIHEKHAALRASVGTDGVPPIGPTLMRRLADARTLMTACVDLMRGGGKAPGVDGLTLEMLDLPERWSLCRRLSQEIRAGEYAPGRDRIVKIPKPGKTGHRELAVQNVRDRIVGRDTVRIVQPVVDPEFSPFSFGGRPKRGTMEALATALALARTEGKWIWIAADVEKAFDRIPFDRFLVACHAHLPDDVVRFVETIAYKGTRRGLRQGNPSSPLFCNVFFDCFLDRPWHRDHPDLPVIRYIDDLLLVCGSIDQANDAYAALVARATGIGTPLKGSAETSIFNLGGGATIEWLGYHIALDNGIPVIRIAERAWPRLALRLAAAYLTPIPPLRAELIIRGWLGYLGPCFEFEDRPAVVSRVRSIASDLAFEEIPSDAELMAVWRAAYRRWKKVQQHAADVLPHRLYLIRQTGSKNEVAAEVPEIGHREGFTDTMSAGQNVINSGFGDTGD